MNAATKKFKVGDRVVVKPEFGTPGVSGRVFTVRKINPKNYACDAEDGGRGLSYPEEALDAFDADKPPTIGRAYVPIDIYYDGEIVTLTGGYAKLDVTAETPLIVIRDTGRETVQVAKLGGDQGRYIKAPKVRLQRRDMAWLKERLAG